MDDWKEKFIPFTVNLFINKKLIDGMLVRYILDNQVPFISSLLSSQEQKHKKEMEELNKEWIEGKRCDNCGNAKNPDVLSSMCDNCWENA